MEKENVKKVHDYFLRALIYQMRLNKRDINFVHELSRVCIC